MQETYMKWDDKANILKQEKNTNLDSRLGGESECEYAANKSIKQKK